MARNSAEGEQRRVTPFFAIRPYMTPAYQFDLKESRAIASEAVICKGCDNRGPDGICTISTTLQHNASSSRLCITATLDGVNGSKIGAHFIPHYPLTIVKRR